MRGAPDLRALPPLRAGVYLHVNVRHNHGNDTFIR